MTKADTSQGIINGLEKQTIDKNNPEGVSD